MLKAEDYFLLRSDCSGSIAKNRFRVEMLWGLSHVLDIFNDVEDFVIVFDNVCDIEILTENSFDFFQIKSRLQAKSYTIKNITSISKNQNNSILGTLYAIKANYAGAVPVRLFLVANRAFKDNKIESFPGKWLAIDSLDADSQQYLIKKLVTELAVKSVDLSNITFVYTPVNLVDPTNEVIGKLIRAYKQVEGCDLVKPNALWETVYAIVHDKACYEFTVETMNDLIAYKGLEKREFKNIFDAYKENVDDSISKVKDIIDKLDSFEFRFNLKQALCDFAMYEHQKKYNRIENKLVDYVKHNKSQFKGSLIEIAKTMAEINKDVFDIEDNDALRLIDCLVVLARFEEGMYNERSGF